MLPLQRVIILGSTGSIGTQALDVAAALPGHLEVVGLAAGSNIELLAEQIQRWQPEVAVVHDEAAFGRLRGNGNLGRTRLLCGMAGLCEAAVWPGADLVLGAMMGAAGLRPTLAALEVGRDVAIANKETLVAAGALVMETARRSGAKLWPVDTEHSALAQCLLGERPEEVAKLTITASGGPFVNATREAIAAAPATSALKHPTWTMGRKITIDSATLMNKGLEMIEAHWLFEVPMDRIEIVVHRQSIVHSLVTFTDGSVKAQLGVPDMRLPIQWGLLRGRRAGGCAPELRLDAMGALTFEPPDLTRFPSIALAREAIRLGGTAPAAMNAANEVAVAAYLDGKLGFYGVTAAIGHVLERHQNTERPSLECVLAADSWARGVTEDFAGQYAAHTFS